MSERSRARKDFHAIVTGAIAEARLRAEARVEAEHLLLALARRPASEAGRVLAESGLDHDRIQDLLDADVARTLEAVGVAPGTIRIPRSTLPRPASPAGAHPRRPPSVVPRGSPGITGTA